MDYQLIRTYSSQADYQGVLGWQWQHNYDRFLVRQGTNMWAFSGPLRNDLYTSADGANFSSPAGFYTRLHRESNGTYTLRERDGMVTMFRAFDGAAAQGKMSSISDRAGNTLSFAYDGLGRLQTVTETMGRTVNYTYNAQGYLNAVEDWAGRRVTFAYSAAGDLIAVTSPPITGTVTGNDFPLGRTERYTYSSGYADPALNHNLLTVTAPNEVAGGGPPWLANTYGTNPLAYDFDRVTGQVCGGTNASGVAAGGTITLTYEELNAGGNPADLALPRNRTIITDRAGNRAEYQHNVNGHRVLLREYSNRNVRAEDPEYWETRYEYNADGEMLRVTYPEGNRIDYSFDSANPDRLQQGNLLEERRVADAARGGGNPLVTRYTYETRNNQVKTITDPRGNDPTYVPPLGAWRADRYRMVYTYDYEEATLGDVNGDGRTNQAKGNVVRVQYPSVLLANGSTQQIVYDYWYNNFGQLTTTVDPEGNVGEYEYYPENDPDGDGQNLTPGRDAATGGYRKAEITDSRTHPRRTSAATPVQIRRSYAYDRAGNRTRVTDGRGVSSYFAFNQAGELVAEHQAAEVTPGSALVAPDYERTYYYDANGNVVRQDVENVVPEIDANLLPTGNHVRDATNPFFSTQMEYDILNQLIGETREISTTATAATGFRYDGNGNLVQTLLPEGNYDAYVFDERNLLYRETRGASDPVQAAATTYRYDGNGNLQQIVGPEGELTDYSYDGFDRNLGYVDALGNIEQYGYDQSGSIVSEAELDGQEGRNPARAFSGSAALTLASRRMRRDEMRRVFRTEEDLFSVALETGVRTPLTTDHDANGVVQRDVLYDRLGRTVASTDDNGRITRLEYDGASRLIKQTDALSNTVTMTYDGEDNLVRQVQAERSPEGLLAPAQYTSWYAYDALGRLERYTDNLGQTERYAYDSAGNRVFQSDAEGSLIADPLGLYPGQVNGHGNTVRYGYDGLGRPLRVLSDLRDGGTWQDAVAESYTWDGNSHLVSVEDDTGNRTRYTYDDLDRVVSETYADGRMHSRAYDRSGNVVRYVDGNGSTTQVTYDLLSRKTRIDVERGAGVMGTTVQTFGYDGLGRTVAATDNNDPDSAGDDSQVTLRYDSLGRRIAEVQDGRTAASGYDGAGNRLALSYPNGQTITMAYDALDRLDTLRKAGSATDMANYDYMGPYRPLQRTLGNGTRMTITWDGAWRITGVTHRRVSDSQVLAGLSYGYDRTYNRSYEERTHSGGTGDTYDYDSLYRLVDVKYGVPDPAADGSEYSHRTGYELDGVGNRLTVTADSTTTTYQPNVLNAYNRVGEEFQAHDRNGNLTHNGVMAFEYDFAGRLVLAEERAMEYRVFLPAVQRPPASGAAAGLASLVRAEVADQAIRFTYDALGRRVTRSSPAGTTRYIYDRTRVIEEEDGTAATLATYVYGTALDDLLAMERGGETYYYHHDSLGSVVALSNASGQVVERYAYDAYGAPTVLSASGAVLDASAVGNTVLYAGRRYDAASGLYETLTRDYDPLQGRFLQRDPMGYVEGLNLYTYARNNPVNRADPTGTESNVHYHDGQGNMHTLSRAELSNLGAPALQTIYNQVNSRGTSLFGSMGPEYAGDSFREMATIREVMAEKGYREFGAYGKQADETMNALQYTAAVASAWFNMMNPIDWVAKPEQCNPLLLGRKYGGWEFKAQKVAVLTSLGAAFSALGLMALETAGVTSVGSQPLFGTGAATGGGAGGTAEAISGASQAGADISSPMLLDAVSQAGAGHIASVAAKDAAVSAMKEYAYTIWQKLLASATKAGVDVGFGQAAAEVKTRLLDIAWKAAQYAFKH